MRLPLPTSPARCWITCSCRCPCACPCACPFSWTKILSAKPHHAPQSQNPNGLISFLHAFTLSELLRNVLRCAGERSSRIHFASIERALWKASSFSLLVTCQCPGKSARQIPCTQCGRVCAPAARMMRLECLGSAHPPPPEPGTW